MACSCNKNNLTLESAIKLAWNCYLISSLHQIVYFNNNSYFVINKINVNDNIKILYDTSNE